MTYMIVSVSLFVIVMGMKLNSKIQTEKRIKLNRGQCEFWADQIIIKNSKRNLK